MAKVIITRGLPGSGKSTWSKQFVIDNPSFVRVNRDDLRYMLSPTFQCGGPLEKVVTVLENMAVSSAISRGYNVVVDATGFSNSTEKWKARLVGLGKIEVEYKDFTDVPLGVCIERDSKRDRTVGAEVITRLYNLHLNPERI